MYTIENKVIVVTGGASGIGYATAEQFLKNGAKTSIIIDVNDDKGMKASEGLKAKYGDNKAVFLKCDVRKDLEEVSAKIIREYKTVDILVNSAGIGSEIIPEELIDLNLTALIKWSLKFKEIMNKENGKDGGTIINISSTLGLGPCSFVPVYVASKYGVVGFSKSLGSPQKFEKTGVRVLTICPGYTRTDLSSGLPKEELMEFLRGVTLQEPEVVGSAVLNVYKKAESGSVWVIDADKLSEFETKDYAINRQAGKD